MQKIFNAPAGLRAGPVELPLVLGPHGDPAPLLHVGDDNGLVHVGAVGHLGTHADGEGSDTALFACLKIRYFF